jgi:hypothetical protein
MDSKNNKSIDKNQNSKDEIAKRLDKLSRIIEVADVDDFIKILTQGQPPGYLKRFSSWCRNTLDSPYHQDMQKAYLSLYALNIIKGSDEFTNDFVRGQANHALKEGEDMARLSIMEFKTKINKES